MATAKKKSAISSRRKTTARQEANIAVAPRKSGILLRFFAVAFCFFLSGIAGLGYEVLWVRLLDKVIGSAPFAVATVISVIMGGLGAGSWLAGRLVSSQASPRTLLALYAKLELVIGACALAIPMVLEIGTPVFRLLYAGLIEHFWLYQLATFIGCSMLLIAPAACMGATLPILCRFFVRDAERIGTGSGWLYGLNTFGAALGSLLCGFFLIRFWGVTVTLYSFIAVNFSVGTVCLLLSRLLPDQNEKQGKPELPRLTENTRAIETPQPARNWLLIIFAVTGCCSMAYEVLWMRLLSLLIGPTTYSFTLVVATFIAGLALGSVIFARLADNSRRPWHLLLASQLGAALSALATSQLLGTSQLFFAKLIYLFHDDFGQLMLLQSAIIAGLILPATIFLGAAFPLINKLYVKSLDDMVRSLGTAYAVNTVGSIAGSLAAGFMIIPTIGMEHGLRLVIGLQIATVSLACLASFRVTRCVVAKRSKKSHSRFPALAQGLLIAFLLTLCCFFPAWPTDQLSRGWYRNFHDLESVLNRTGWLTALTLGVREISSHRQGLEVVYKGEGIAGFTTVEKEITSLGTTEYAMFNSGKADASSHGDRSTQALSAHIPMLFHPHAEEVMVLGLASGMTAGECLLYPLKRLDIVEINTKVIEAADRYFSTWNNSCLHDPRTRVLAQDGRNHLALTDALYDVIISEPSNPWMAGLANLYSREFFTLARARLKTGGVFAQWIQAYEMDWQTFSLLGRTFSNVFPKGAMVKVGPVDYLLLGYADDEGNRENFTWSTARSNYVFARQSSNIKLPGIEFLAHLILTEDLPGLFGSGQLHTDNRPFLEYLAPQRLNCSTLNIDEIVAPHRKLRPKTQAFMAAHNTINTYLDLIEFSASAGVPIFNLLTLGNLEEQQANRYRSIIEDYCQRLLLPSYALISDPELRHSCASAQSLIIKMKIAAGEGTFVDRYNLALANITTDNKQAAMNGLETLVSEDTENEQALAALGLLLVQHGDKSRAEQIFSKLATLSPQNIEVNKWLAALRKKGSGS